MANPLIGSYNSPKPQPPIQVVAIPGPRGPRGRDASSNFREAKLIIPGGVAAGQVGNLFTTPLNIVPSPGLGKAIEVISASANLIFATTAYDNPNFLQLFTKDAETPQLDITGFQSSGHSIFEKFIGISAGGNRQLLENKPLTVTSDSDATIGDSPITVYVAYRIVSIP